MRTKLKNVPKPKAVMRSTAISISTKFDQALLFHQQGQLGQAQALYLEILNAQPNFADALHLLGVIEFQIKNYQKALEFIGKAIDLNQNNAVFYYNRGLVLQDCKQLEAAIANYDQATKITPDYADAFSNRGNALLALKRPDAAIVSYDQAIVIKSDFAEAYFNRGNALQEIKQFDAAIASYDQAIRIKVDYVKAYFNRGNALKERKQYAAAIVSYDHALNIKPDYEYGFGERLNTKMLICDWSNFDIELKELERKIAVGEKTAAPFSVLSLTTSLSLQYKVTEIFVRDKYPINSLLGDLVKPPRRQRIRIAYYSADFHNHATTCLMAELFERHDKNKFELFGFSFGPNKNDEMRLRVSSAFDHFLDVQNQSAQAIATLSRELGIDIAIDLKGFTTDQRAEIFSFRAAPIQVHYLGYPGTMATTYMDYMVADKTVIPERSQQYYSEKIVYLPHTYQVNDRKRHISDKQFSREEWGLPKVGFVFCCFNNSYKITPSIFSCWMQILKKVDGSVLWLLEDNSDAVLNLRKEAQRRGVNKDRLVFAHRLPLDQHLTRHQAADLFLDTLPCNAHTTCSDALWAGLPLITCSGDAFASRVAASLLRAIELPEMITNTQDEYESLAIELATCPERLQAIKQKLEKNRLSTSLFDSQLFTLHIEEAYVQMIKRYHADLPPDHIYVGEGNCAKGTDMN